MFPASPLVAVWIATLLASLARSDGTPPQAGSPLGRPSDGSRLVQVSLLADRSAVRAGETFHLGVRLRVEPEWHVYWENPGDAGLPTEVVFGAPPGFEVGALRFPPPTRHDDEGDIVSFVHEGEVLLLADVRAPQVLEPGVKLKFTADASWLVCKTICLPGKGSATLELAGAAQSTPANEPLFATALARLPVKWAALLGDKVQPVVQIAADKHTFTVTIAVPGASTLEFFPAPSKDSQLSFRKVVTTRAGATIELGFTQLASSPNFDYRGVLVIGDSKGSRSCLQERWSPETR